MSETDKVDPEYKKQLDDQAAALKEYRNLLSASEIKSQESYDKTLVTLSAGALGVSIAFVKDIIGDNEPVLTWTLITAWFMWAASLTSVVASFYCSQRALTAAIRRCDEGRHDAPPDSWAKATALLNGLAGIAFIIGVLFLCFFTTANLNQKHGAKFMSDKKNETFSKGLLPQQAPTIPAYFPAGEPLVGQLPPQAPVITPAPTSVPTPSSAPTSTSEYVPTTKQD